MVSTACESSCVPVDPKIYSEQNHPWFIGSMHPECVCLHESAFCVLNYIFGELGLCSERLELPGSWSEWRTPLQNTGDSQRTWRKCNCCVCTERVVTPALPLSQGYWGNEGECVWRGSASVTWAFGGLDLLMLRVTSSSLVAPLFFSGCDPRIHSQLKFKLAGWGTYFWLFESCPIPFPTDCAGVCACSVASVVSASVRPYRL